MFGISAFLAVLFLASGHEQVRDYSLYNFEAFAKEFGKKYSDEEIPRRKASFDANMEKIAAHNAEYKEGRHQWYAAVNHLTDATEEEFQSLRSTKYSPSAHPSVQLTPKDANPASVDWREKNVVTPVKNQQSCGSCWAFSATETVESAYAIASGKLLTLAPQTYVDCVKNPYSCGGTGGCEGATMELAFNLTAQTGIALEDDLPYTGRDSACKEYKAAVKVTGYVKNPTNDALALETAVATKGPQSITVAASSWMLYGGGVFTGCSKGGPFSKPDSTLDHGVQLVGYTKEYWIIRNSWGPGWGLKGYMHLTRAHDDKTFVDKNPADGVACKPVPKTQTIGGECGILFDTSYPTGAMAATNEVVV
jgi:cathepsin L